MDVGVLAGAHQRRAVVFGMATLGALARRRCWHVDVSVCRVMCGWEWASGRMGMWARWHVGALVEVGMLGGVGALAHWRDSVLA